VHSLLSKGVIEVDASGEIVRRSPVNIQYTSWGLLHLCLRESFESLAVESEGSSYDYGCTVEKVEEQGDMVLVSYSTKGQQLTMEADLVIGADGASSSIRECLLPQVRRTYAGYVIWRGLVPENDLSKAGRDMFVENGSVHWGEEFIAICYPIPDETTGIGIGKRLANWGWYQNLSEGDLDELMHDVNGERHKFTLPMGKMSPKLMAKQYAHAKETMPPPFVELVTKTALPFIQVVTDVLSPRNLFYGGKVVLIGDAVAGIR
jgi:2-polyprenyl-6-methoxyphenol hydroxylase-like FAD-dependent oxidoreductase